MVFDLNHKLWIATTKEIRQMLKKQNRLKKIDPPDEKPISFKIFSELYVLYVELVNKLTSIYYNTFQVQKREVVRKLVENATKQLMMLKEELMELELSEYVYIDNALIARKLTPSDMMIWRSPDFLYRRPLEIQNILMDNKLFMNEAEKEETAAKDWIEVKNAIELIQAHERARRSRIYKANIKYDKKKFLKILLRKKVNYTFTFKPNQTMSIPVKRTIFNAEFVKKNESCQDLLNNDKDEIQADEIDALNDIRNRAASVIQSWWRAYKQKKIYKIKKQFKKEMLGVKKTRKLCRPSRFSDSIQEMYRHEQTKKRLDDEFVKLIMDERTRLLQLKTPWMMEDISDHIRAWFLEFYEKTMNFHPYPDPIKEGTILVVKDETMKPDDFLQSLTKKPMSKEEKKKLKDKARNEKKKKKEKELQNKLKDEKRRKKLKDNGIIDVAYSIYSSEAIKQIEETMEKFTADWRDIDEYLNKYHAPIKEWIIEDQMDIIHHELRELVDEYMRIEYELLREAWAEDEKVPYKALKVKNKKVKKEKKKKKPFDLTEDRSLDSLYQELKDKGVIEKIAHKDFDEFIAEFNFLANDTRDADYLTTLGPAMGDIKMVIQECMLGMSEFQLPKPKSLLLVGPLNCGKKLLCNIIASEIDAVFINLSPEKVVQFADDMEMFIHIVMKVARAFQPVILYIEEAHRLFIKKVPPEMADIKPKLLASYLDKKILKTIKTEEKIMLIGTSNAPFEGGGGIKKCFQKIVMIPKCDYGSSFLIWLDLMTENVPEELEGYAYSALARVMQAFTCGDVTNNIADTLKVERQFRLKIQPLDPNEFLEYFFTQCDPAIYPPEEKLMKKFDKWFGSSNKYLQLRKSFLAAKNAKNKGKK